MFVLRVHFPQTVQPLKKIVRNLSHHSSISYTRGESFVNTSTVFESTYRNVSSIRTPKWRNSSGISSSPSNYMKHSINPYVETRFDTEGYTWSQWSTVTNGRSIIVIQTNVVTTLHRIMNQCSYVMREVFEIELLFHDCSMSQIKSSPTQHYWIS